MPSWIINQVYTMSRYGVKFHINETLTVSLTLSHHTSIRLTNKLLRAGTRVFLGKKRSLLTMNAQLRKIMMARMTRRRLYLWRKAFCHDRRVGFVHCVNMLGL